MSIIHINYFFSSGIFFRYVLTQAVVKSPVGGDYLSSQCKTYLLDKGIELVPPAIVAYKEIMKSEESPIWKRRDVPSNLTESWYNYMIKVHKQKYTRSPWLMNTCF